jgi:hypothetical protein
VSEVLVSAVPAEHVLNVWPKIRDYIAEVVLRTHGRYEVEDVLSQLLDESHLLWIAFEGEHVKGAVVSCFQFYPRKKFLSCPFVTGEDFASWKGPILEVLHSFARDNGCEGIEATGRLGWARVFKDDGYEALWQTFQLSDTRVGEDNG